MDNKKEDDNIGSFYMGRMRPPPQPKRQLPPGLLTVLALLILGCIIWYAYPRGAEKYTDIDVPVVKADLAPIKAEPVDPGGMEVRHQDSTVFDPLDKKTGNEVEKLMPSPEEPLNKEEVIKPEVTTKMAPKLDMDLQLKDATNNVEKVVTKTPEKTKPEEAKPAEKEVVTAPIKDEKKKPEEKPAAPIAEKSASSKVYIQLGSYRDTAGAKADWEKLKKKYPGFFGKVPNKIEKTDIPGKGIYYRLHAGKLAEARAREICDILKTANPGGCILVRKELK